MFVTLIDIIVTQLLCQDLIGFGMNSKDITERCESNTSSFMVTSSKLVGDRLCCAVRISTYC